IIGTEAAQRRTPCDAPGVEADEVEARADRGREQARGEVREVDPGATGSAGVDEQRADPMRRIGRRNPQQTEADRGTARAAPIERDLHRAAGEPTVAAVPIDAPPHRGGMGGATGARPEGT